MAITWSGVFPAVTTQFSKDLSINPEATQRMVDRLMTEGVHGLVALGTVGENNSLEPDEKRAMLRAIIEAVDGRAPVLTGVSEMTTAAACRFVVDAVALGVDGLMVLPAMAYAPSAAELDYHIRTVAAATSAPVMLYNNPLAYRVNIPVESLKSWSDVETIVALKESSEDTRRFLDVQNACGDRFTLFAGLDDIALEGLLLGARGWVSGLTNVFPEESLLIWRLVQEGRVAEAREIYRWFMPLLHLDSQSNLVQCIKLAEEIVGRGSERVRPPRLPLAGEERRRVIRLVEEAAASRPYLKFRRAAE